MLQKTPFVSVIVPNYNHERYLDQRLQSIFDQTYQDYEVIILDDCSVDKSREVVERYRNHSKVSYVLFNEINSGSSFRQWRKGLELAKGEWIWIAESDDYSANDLLNVLVGQATKYDNVAISYCQSKEVDEKGEGWREMSWHTDKVDKEYWQKDYYNNGLNEIKKCLWHINSIPNASAVLFRKSAYLSADKSFETMKMCGDWMLWVQLLKAGNIAFCSQPLNSFRKHSTTTRVLETLDKKKLLVEEEYRVAKDIRRTIKELPYFSVKKKVLRMIKYYCSLYTTKEIMSYIKKPATYKKPIPFFNLVSVYFTRLVFVKTKRLFFR